MEAKIKELCTGLISHQELEQNPHTWLDVILNDIESIKKSEVWKAVREGMGTLWRRWLGRIPGVGRGGRLAGHE